MSIIHKSTVSKYFEDFSIGDKYVIPSRTQTSAIFSMFQAASGDNDQIHYDKEFCYNNDECKNRGFTYYCNSDEDIKIFSENLDMMYNNNFVSLYNIKEIYDNNTQLKADKIDFDILTKNVSINMNENTEKVKIIYK